MCEISALYIYPLKSGAGVAVDSARLDAFGLVGDRRWMVIDADTNEFVSQRTIPRLCLVGAHWHPEGLALTAPDEPGVVIPTPHDERRSVDIWRSTMSALDAGDDAAAWISRVLKGNHRLVYAPDDADRLVDPRYAHHQERVAFADGFPLLLIGQASLDDLNRRLPAPVPMNRFRPNVVVSGAEPYAEDTWSRIRIGSVECDVVKPCARCAITMVDQTTGVKSGPEPLRTLARYRRRGNDALFGQNVIHAGPGEIRVGDPIRVL